MYRRCLWKCGQSWEESLVSAKRGDEAHRLHIDLQGQEQYLPFSGVHYGTPHMVGCLSWCLVCAS